MKDDIAITARQVERYRKILGYTQDELARAMGLGVDCIRKWEQGKTKCSGPAALLIGRMVEDAKQAVGS